MELKHSRIMRGKNQGNIREKPEVIRGRDEGENEGVEIWWENWVRKLNQG